MPPLVPCGNIVFHKTSSWCRKGWGHDSSRCLVSSARHWGSPPSVADPVSLGELCHGGRAGGLAAASRGPGAVRWDFQARPRLTPSPGLPTPSAPLVLKATCGFDVPHPAQPPCRCSSSLERAVRTRGWEQFPGSGALGASGLQACTGPGGPADLQWSGMC